MAFARSPAGRVNGFIVTGGYVPLNPETGEAEVGSIEVETLRTLDNLKLVLEQAGSSLDKVVKVNVLLADLTGFEAERSLPGVLPSDFPARRTTQSALVGGFNVEIDCIAPE